MDQEREDYGDPAPPRRRTAEFLFALFHCALLVVVTTAGVGGLLWLVGNASKFD